jgi:hypothetical protein
MPTPKFKPGVSGNPKGRPPAKIKAAEVRAAINNNLTDIINAMIERALSGDVAAGKVLLDRVCPTLKPQATPINIDINPDASLAQIGDGLIKATLTGAIPADVGAQLITALANQSKIVELDELVKRIEALEGCKP